MAPLQVTVGSEPPAQGPTLAARPAAGDEVVITGMSGIFPRSESTQKFMENLYSKVDMVTDGPRWIFNHPEVPKHVGLVNDLGKFDAQFFSVHHKQAVTMEPMCRKLLEHAYGAIYDAGLNPAELKGKKVGVFTGSSVSDTVKNYLYNAKQRNGFGITGCNKAMNANRISYWIDGKGPSYSVDDDCASSMVCLENAYRSIRSGECDAAIVGGNNLCLHPNLSLNMKRAGLLCMDGKTKCFDKNGDGFVRAEAIGVLLLQKAKDAKRIYSEICYVKTKFTPNPNADILHCRDSENLKEFLEEFYSEINVSPNEVEYVEAYGSGTADKDGVELKAIGEVFAKEKSIKIGAVASNIGHSEAASGICSLTKVCLAYHKGELPANLNYSEPQDHISSVRDGRVKVVQENTPFSRGYIAVNSFSYSGVNIHVLLKGHYKPKDPERYKCNIPYIVVASGRTLQCVKTILDSLNNQPIDPEQVGLFHSIHENDIRGHMCRGYNVLDTNEDKQTISLAKHVDYCQVSSRPVWFVYSGMGSQWAGMGADLMRISIFADAIKRCHKVLEPKGIDLIRILTEPDKKIYDNILNSFVGIAAVQIGLTDVLNQMGIVPDNIIGHSVGELGCAYADGCFTAEEMILSAYSRGLVSVQTEFIRGSMAAVGLGYKDVKSLCPPKIAVACHNSPESSTISGPAEDMKLFVDKLKERGIFAKEVPCSNIAYHSRYIADAGPGLLKYLSEVIKEPKLRSKKWVSTSVPLDKSDEPMNRYSSAHYHTNNLLSPVLFEESAMQIPKNAILIEIAPHGLLQAILKRSHESCLNIPLTRRGHANPVQYLLEAVGKLYQDGLNPKVDVLYPKIEFPVSTGTPLLSQLVQWEHSEDWPEAAYSVTDIVTANVRECVVYIGDDDFKYLEGHIRDGTTVFSEAALLVLVWETLAMQRGVDYKNLPVMFKDVQFLDEVIIDAKQPLQLTIMIQKGTQKFEVCHGERLVCVNGYIYEKEEKFQEKIQFFFKLECKLLEQEQSDDEDNVILTTEDTYKILHKRGFTYRNAFQSLHSYNAKRKMANIKWTDRWVTYIDALIQLNALARDHDGVAKPKLIKKLSLDSKELDEEINKFVDDGITYYNAQMFENTGISRCAGVELENIVFTEKPKTQKGSNILETEYFIPHFPTKNMDLNTAVLVNLQIMANNITENKTKITEIVTDSTPVLINSLKAVVEKVPIADFDVELNQVSISTLQNIGVGKTDVFIVDDLLQNDKKINDIHRVLTHKTFILALENENFEGFTTEGKVSKLFNVITAMSIQNKTLVLLNKADAAQNENVTYISIASIDKFSWIPRIEFELQKSRRVVLVSQNQPNCGLLGFFKHLSKAYKDQISLIVVDDTQAPVFDPEHIIFKDQLQKKLALNVLKEGQWGGYYHLPCARSIITENFKLTTAGVSTIDSLMWTEGTPVSDENISVQVCYAGPSVRDTLKSVEKLDNHSNCFGMDFSGIDSKGNRVMGLMSEGAIARTVAADPDLLWPVPEHWSLEEAATVPLPYIHAYYLLTMRYPLIKHKSVFISGGAGALGQAVISICLSLDCAVYTTVSNIAKKNFLLKLFPKLNENNVFYSRHDTFYYGIMRSSQGKLCDVVINSHSGKLREAAMKCVACSGVFYDININDMRDNNDFGLYYLFGERNYLAINLQNLFMYPMEKKNLQLYVSEGIAQGVVKPTSHIVYPACDVARAFRLLSSSRHRGRVLIDMNDSVTLDKSLEIKPRMNYSSENTYIVVCDDNNLGLEFVDRLLNNGAKNLVIHLKTNLRGGFFYAKMASWRKFNASIEISSENLETVEGCFNLLKTGIKSGPIGGLFIFQKPENVLKSERLDQEYFELRYSETTLVVENLNFTFSNCIDLRYFVVVNHSSKDFSNEYSVAAIERICQTRNKIGLPALTFKILLLDELDQYLDHSKLKIHPQSISAALDGLENSLKFEYNNAISFSLKEQCCSGFLQKVLRIIGIKNINDIGEDVTLKELLVDDVNIEKIKYLLKQMYQINYSGATIQEMSIGSFKSIQNYTSNERERGMGVFFSFINKDECMATEPMVTMDTKVGKHTETEELLDMEATYLMLVPGFGGNYHIFKDVCKRLNVNAITFQLGPDLIDNDTSIQEMALNIMKIMKKRFELKSKFYLLGYSFGVNVALEIAALMENEGHIGVVYCLDSSPDALRVQLDAYIGNLTDAQLQDTIVEHMYKLMTGHDNQDLKQDLEKLDNWSDKVQACILRVRSLVSYSHQYKKSIIEEAYRRLKLAREYQPNFLLNSKLILIKGIPHPNTKNLSDNYNLSKFTKQPVKIINLESDHASIPYNFEVSNIINKFLDPTILEEFRKKNLCETYQVFKATTY